MKIPKWLMNWLTARNVAIAAFRAKLDALSDKLDAPVEWKDALEAWFSENTELEPETVLAFVALVYAEIKSGAPGYDSQHGGGA